MLQALLGSEREYQGKKNKATESINPLNTNLSKKRKNSSKEGLIHFGIFQREGMGEMNDSCHWNTIWCLLLFWHPGMGTTIMKRDSWVIGRKNVGRNSLQDPYLLMGWKKTSGRTWRGPENQGNHLPPDHSFLHKMNQQLPGNLMVVVGTCSRRTHEHKQTSQWLSKHLVIERTHFYSGINQTFSELEEWNSLSQVYKGIDILCENAKCEMSQMTRWINAATDQGELTNRWRFQSGRNTAKQKPRNGQGKTLSR